MQSTASGARSFKRSLSWALGLSALVGAACAAIEREPRAPVLSARVEQAPPSARSERLHAACTKFVAEHGVVGARVVVLENGELVFHGGFGFSDREAQRATIPDTLFRWGSISKPVAAALVLQFVEEGKLELDRDVRGYASELASLSAPITLRQLLSHTSGVRHYAAGKVDNSAKQRTTREALELFLADPLLFPPGTEHSYSTHAYTIVAHVLESVANQPFERLVRERIAKRGAPTLDCERRREDKPARAKLYNLEVGRVALLQLVAEDNSWKYAGGGLESTALDLARFGQLMLDDELVTRASRDQMWTPLKLADGSTRDYGLGWRLAPARGVVRHSGSQQGCNTELLLDPARRRVVAVMMNTQGGGAPDLGQELFALLD